MEAFEQPVKNECPYPKDKSTEHDLFADASAASSRLRGKCPGDPVCGQTSNRPTLPCHRQQIRSLHWQVPAWCSKPSFWAWAHLLRQQPCLQKRHRLQRHKPHIRQVG